MRYGALVACAVAATLVGSVHAQPKIPKIGLVMPAGAKAGASLEVAVTGSNLDDVEGLHFSFPGAKVKPLQSEMAPTMKGKPAPKGMAAAGQQTTYRFQVEVPAGASLGFHDLRVVTKAGVSNPRVFVVGDLPEVVEKEPNDDVPLAHKIDLNTTVNGVIGTATDVDYYQFAGKKGQRVVAFVAASSIDSRLPAAVQLYSIGGKYLGFNRNFQQNDAALDAVLPEDGDYLVRVFSFSHTVGGPDYAYRLTVTTNPWIDAALPVALEPGKATPVTLWGKNLPGGVPDPTRMLDGRPLEKASVTVTAPPANGGFTYSGFAVPAQSQIDAFEHRVKGAGGMSNPVLLTHARGKAVVEVEPNDRPEQATPLALPGEASGMIEKRGDVDWYKFSAKAGETLGIELFGERFGPGIDLRFVVQNAKGTTLSTQDENQEIMANQLYSRTEDPAYYRFTPPADGDYFVGVSNGAGDNTFGPRHVYSLRVGPETGDFQVVAMPISQLAPDSALVGADGHYAFNAYVWRMGGFAGDVTIQATKLPPGATMKPQVISSTQKQAAFAVGAAPGAPAFAGALQLEATATIGGKKIVRAVRSATLSYPVVANNVPTLSRMDREVVLAIRDKAAYRLIPSADKITVLQGDPIKLSVRMDAPADFKSVQVTAAALPTGMVLAPATLVPGGKEVALQFDAKTTVLPGNYTLILRGQTQPVTNKPPPPKAVGPNFVEHSAPISLTIVPKSLLKIKTLENTLKAPRGGKIELPVQMTRLFPFEGPVQIELVTTNKAFSAAPTSAKSADETVKLTIAVSADAPIGPAPVVVRVTARFNDLPVVHETKVPLAVTK